MNGFHQHRDVYEKVERRETKADIEKRSPRGDSEMGGHGERDELYCRTHQRHSGVTPRETRLHRCTAVDAIPSDNRAEVGQRNIERAKICSVDGVCLVGLECSAADSLLRIPAVLSVSFVHHVQIKPHRIIGENTSTAVVSLPINNNV